MLPLLSLLGVAFAATLWPDQNSDDTTEPETASGDLSASGTTTSEDGADGSPLQFASSTSVQATDILATAQQALLDAENENITGTDGDDLLYGFDGRDAISGGLGADQLDGGNGDDNLFGNDDSEGDELIGGDGHDHLWLGAGDIGTGGSGDDIFHVSEDAEGPAVITDFNPDDDRIAVYYDPAGSVPELTTEDSDAGIYLKADNQVVAIVQGAPALDLGAVQLVPDIAA